MSLVVGVTGGIGSGKSTVASLFHTIHKVPLVDADAISRALTAPNGIALAAIRTAFGADFFHADGTLRRDKLRDVIFHDAAQRKNLESILHPLIRKKIRAEIREQNAPYVIAMIPLLIKSTCSENPDNHRYDDVINRILVVDCSEETQRRRVMQRNGFSPDAVSAIMAQQSSRQTRLQRADDVIENEGLVEDLIPPINTLHQTYLQLAG